MTGFSVVTGARCLVILVLCCWWSTASAATPGNPLASLSGTCLQYRDTQRTAVRFERPFDRKPVAEMVMAEFVTDAGPGGFTIHVAGSVEGGENGSGGRSWHLIERPSSPLRGDVGCLEGAPPFAWTLRVFDVPAAPTSFEGTIAFSPLLSRWDGQGGSQRLAFRAPAGGSYVAHFNVTVGAIGVRTPGREPRTLASPTALNLGQQNRGVITITLDPRDGPPAAYRLTITPVPARIVDLAWDRAAIRPGTITRATYTATGDTTVTGTVQTIAGGAIRTLGNGLKVEMGKRSLTWDGLNSAGRPVPDGRYRIEISSSDYWKNTSRATAPVIVDSTPPTIRTITVGQIRPDQGLVIEVGDALAGLKSGTITVRGRSLVRLRPAQKRYVVIPNGGWRGTERHVVVTAVDNSGNTTTRLVPVRVAGAPAEAVVIATEIYSEAPQFESKPSLLNFAMGSRYWVSDIQWHTWGGSEARGSGFTNEKICEPNCAESNTVARTPVTVVAFARQACKGGQIAYTKVRLSITGRIPFTQARYCGTGD